jgi:hypothetical protein
VDNFIGEQGTSQIGDLWTTNFGLDTRWQPCDSSLQNPHIAAPSRDLAVTEFIVDKQVLLSPDGHDRLIPPRALVGHGRGVFVGFQDCRIHVQRGGSLWRVRLHGSQDAPVCSSRTR